MIEFLRRKRRLAALGGVAVLAVVMLVLVLPAFAATSTGFNGATSSTQNVQPTYLASGGENDCALFTLHGGTVGTDQYFASNPKAISAKPQTLTATNGMAVTLTVTVDKSYTHLSFSVSGGVVTDVGIKGGNGTDWYSYELKPGGGVTSDAGLTAPAQSANGQPPFYGLSQTVFCYTPKITCQANVPLSDPQHPGETIEVASCAGKSNVFFDFNSGSLGNGQNFVSVFSYGGAGSPTTPMVEQITGTLPDDTQPTLRYSDTNPPGPLHDMLFCQKDPRAGGADLLALAQQYQDVSTAGQILQPNETSCLIAMRTWVDTNGVLHFEAYVYSDIDGYRTY